MTSAEASEKIQRAREIATEHFKHHSPDDEALLDQLQVTHHDLMPELAHEIRKLKLIHQARLILADDTIRQDPTDDAVVPKKLGRFLLKDQLGAGAFGTVWRAFDEKLQRDVAIKILRNQLALDGTQQNELIQRFTREALSAAQLNHPNIVAIHEVGVEGDTHFIVSELVEGMSLDQWLLKRRPAINRIEEWLSDICHALHHAHHSGIVHRDLKPSNMLVDERNSLRLLDFGLAKNDAVQDELATIDGQLIGTPCYMAPEQARGDAGNADARSDIFSLGVVLYELLTGERPFRGSREMLLFQLQHDEPQRPRKLSRNVPRDLETICLKCLEKAPEDRYQSAEAVLAELDRHKSGKPISARPISTVARVFRAAKRHRGLTASALLAAAILITAPVLAIYESLLRRESEQVAEQAKVNANLAEREIATAKLMAARSKRSAMQLGQRVDGLSAVILASQRSAESASQLRTDAIAALALSDLEIEEVLALKHDATALAIDDHSLIDGSILESSAICLGTSEVMLGDRIVGVNRGQPARQAEIVCDETIATISFLKPRLQQANYPGPPRHFELALWEIGNEKPREPARFRLAGLHAFDVDRKNKLYAFIPPEFNRRGHIVRIGDSTSEKPPKIAYRDLELPFTPEFLRLRPIAFQEGPPSDKPVLAIAPRLKNMVVIIGGRESPLIYNLLRRFTESEFVPQNVRDRPGIRAIEWSPSGKYLGVVCVDGKNHGNLLILEVGEDIREHRRIEIPMRTDRIRFYDDEHCFTGALDRTSLWNFDTKDELLSFDGTIAALDTNGRIVIRNRRELRIGRVHIASERRKISHEACQALLLSDDGDKLLTIEHMRDEGVNAAYLRLNSTRNGEILSYHRFAHLLSYWTSIDDDTRYLVTHSENGIQLWDCNSPVLEPKPLRPGHALVRMFQQMFGQTLRPERKSLTGSMNAFIYRDQTGDMHWFANEAGEKSIGVFRSLSDIELSHNNSWLAIGLSAGGIRVGIPGDRLSTTLAAGMHSPQIAFSPREDLLVATFGGTYKVWKTGSWTLHGEGKRTPYHDAPGAVGFSPDSNYLAVAESPQRIQVINLATMQEELTIDSPSSHSRVTCLSFSGNGETLAVAYNNGIEIWKLDQIRKWLSDTGLMPKSQ